MSATAATDERLNTDLVDIGVEEEDSKGNKVEKEPISIRSGGSKKKTRSKITKMDNTTKVTPKNNNAVVAVNNTYPYATVHSLDTLFQTLFRCAPD